MSISNLLSDNNYKLNCKSLTSKGNVSAVGGLTASPQLDSDGSLVGNAHLAFTGDTGIPYMTSSQDEWRLGSNGAGAGINMKWTNSGQNGTITVNGDVNADNTPALRGQATWSGGSTSVSIPSAGSTSSHHVHITPIFPPSEAVVFSHVVAGTDEFTVHLSGANTSNDFQFNWMLYKPHA